MKLKYFGDSYDIVKKSLIGWLLEFGKWTTHPMFTERVTNGEAAQFSRLIGTSLLSVEVLTLQTCRDEYFSSCKKAGHLFLDPDTGIRLEPCRGKKSQNFVFGPELVEWCGHRPAALTLVFDQSYSRQFNRAILMRKKLQYFADKNIFGFAYDSHATFLLLGADSMLVESAREKLLEISGLPAHRLVSCDSKGKLRTE